MTLNELLPVIKRASKNVAFQWPGVIEADDVEQSIYMRLLESDGSVEKILLMDDRARYRAIVGIGHQLASAERTSYDHFKGSYRYSVGEIRDLLKQGILTDPPQNFKAEFVDLTEALGGIAPQYVEAITTRYVEEEFPQSTSGKDALKNGLTSLVNEMNSVQKRRFKARTDGLGTREILTRAQALDRVSSEYDGVDE